MYYQGAVVEDEEGWSVDGSGPAEKGKDDYFEWGSPAGSLIRNI